MKPTTYRIPNAKVFLRDDGVIVPKPAEGATVVRATKANADQLVAAYVGAELHTLREINLGDAILTDWGASHDTRQAVKYVVEATEFIVFVSEVIELAVHIADWMGAFGPGAPDPVIMLLGHIDRRLSQIEDTVLQAWATTRSSMLAFLQAHSTVALKTAQQFLEAGRPADDPVWAAKIALAERDSLLAVETFVGSGIDGGFWLRPFSLKALGVDPNAIHSTWLGHYPNPNQVHQNPVWDYRFTLPVVSYAIMARLAVLKAVAPQSFLPDQPGCREVKGYVQFLRKVAERMQSGIWAIDDLDMSEAGQFHFLWSGKMVMAAANVFSGLSLYRTLYAHQLPPPSAHEEWLWPASLVDPHMIGQGNDHILALGRENARLIGSHWWHVIWRGIGMVELCQLISDVERACIAPGPGTVVFPDTHPNNTIGDLLGVAQRLVSQSQNDPKARRAAEAAAALVRYTPSGDAARDSIRTFEIYQALLAGGENARAIIAAGNEEILKLAPVRRKPAAAPKKKADKPKTAGYRSRKK